ncbi:MAG: hypothetical protein ACTSRG_06015 [Candidatus Helarchaeota archaeon]
MNLKLQYKFVLLLIISGSVLYIFSFKTFLSLFAIMLTVGGSAIFLIYFEKRWIEQKYLIRGLVSTLLFAVVYGILEYVFFDATWNYWFKISSLFPSKYFYWIFMAILNFTLVFYFSHKSIALSTLSIPLFSVNEDLWYWITKSIHNGTWVFPVPNWFDQRFSIFGLGEPIPFFPFLPRFYFVGWFLIGILFYIQFKNLEGRKFIISVGIYCVFSFLCLLLVPFPYCRFINNLLYYFNKLCQQLFFV